MKNFRECAATSFDWLDVRKETGFSNFCYVDEKFDSSPTLRRILSLARKHGFQSMLVEDIQEKDCELLEQENQALAVRSKNYTHSSVNRLIFLDSQKDAAPSRAIGYAVFKQDHFKDKTPTTHVYESVIAPVRGAAQNNFIHTPRNYTIQTQFGSLETSGVIYAQQNDTTFVCAHVALRSVLSCLMPEADFTYEQMNQCIGVDHKTRKVGDGVGLSPADLRHIITSQGLAYADISHEPSKSDDFHFEGEFQRELYGSIESGFPALLGFELDGGSSRHIIPVFGHTFNDDTWVAESEKHYFASKLGYFSSENWLSTFNAHDDNFGPYLCIPRHYLKKENFRLLLGLRLQAPVSEATEIEAVALVYAKVFTAAFDSSGTRWQQRLALFAQESLLVLRTVRVDKCSYLRHLTSDLSWNGDSCRSDALAALDACLPSTFWMVELSAPELFPASRHKFGEILLRSDIALPEPLDTTLLCACRLPGLIVIQHEDQTLSTLDSGVQSHVPLYQSPTLYHHPTS